VTVTFGVPEITTPVLVLHTMPYGETSAILRLLSRDLGLVSGIARGARRAKSRTGPRLDIFSVGSATLLIKPHRDLHPLTSFELSQAHGALAGDVARFAAASALCELALKCASTEPLPGAYDAATAGLDALEHAPAEDADTVALLACWGLVVALGFAPTLDRCVICGEASDGAVAFSAAQGGALCSKHRRGERASSLGEPDAAALSAFISGRLPDAPLDSRHVAAHRRLLLSFIRHHLAEHRALPALAFWDAESWSTDPRVR
jgi:DNA repair protein RecO (recombination protein O)